MYWWLIGAAVAWYALAAAAIRRLPRDDTATRTEDAAQRFGFWLLSPILAPLVLAAAFTHYVLTPPEKHP